MAKIVPFKGILYNSKSVKDIAKVVSPPYDVISVEKQKELYERHPNNVIRLIIGKEEANDSAENNRYTRSAAYLRDWLKNGILARDEMPSLYLTSLSFTCKQERITRYGIIAAVKLEPFEKKIILPHERTFSRVKSERLQLLKISRANYSPIFTLYHDRQNILEQVKTAVLDDAPIVDIVDDEDNFHKLWRIADPAIINKISSALYQERLLIADGHHRYETALKYRDWLAEQVPDFTEAHPANYMMMYLCSMDDSGLVVLPAHRMLKSISAEQLKGFVRKASDYFDITRYPFTLQTMEMVREELVIKLKENYTTGTIGVAMKDSMEYHLLAMRPNLPIHNLGGGLSPQLKNLDVSILTNLIFMEVLGFDQERLDNDQLIGYSSSDEIAVDQVFKGNFDMAFILNPTKIEQVKEIAEAGEIMPRKTTYFYPKALTGLVMNLLAP